MYQCSDVTAVSAMTHSPFNGRLHYRRGNSLSCALYQHHTGSVYLSSSTAEEELEELVGRLHTPWRTRKEMYEGIETEGSREEMGEEREGRKGRGGDGRLWREGRGKGPESYKTIHLTTYSTL